MNLPALSIDQALNNIKPLPEYPVICQYINSLVEKSNVVTLGTDQAFALRDKSGEIRAFKQRLHLSGSNGGLVQPVCTGPFTVSAQGYEMWAEVKGASCIFPKTVLVGTEHKLNPYVERDDKNGRILCIYARAIAFCYSSKGIPQVCDWSTMFDTPSYRMIDLLGKAKKYPQAFRLLPNEMTPDKEGTWAKYPFDECTNLWVDTSHDEVLQWYAQIINREKKAIDFAQTFARRNALKHLSGLQKTPDGKAVWDLDVLSWRPTSGNIVKWDATQYSQLQDRVESMITGDCDEFAKKPLELKSGAERISDEQGYEVLEAGTDPEDQVDVIGASGTQAPPAPPKAHPAKPEPAPEKPEQKPAPVQYSPEERKILNNYDVAKDNFPNEYRQACADLKLNPAPVPAHTPKEAEAICKRISEILDEMAM